MKLRLTIARAMVLFGLVTATGLAAVVFTGVYAVSDVKIGGPLYNQIKLGNDLVADILPPPEYVIEFLSRSHAGTEQSCRARGASRPSRAVEEGL